MGNYGQRSGIIEIHMVHRTEHDVLYGRLRPYNTYIGTRRLWRMYNFNALYGCNYHYFLWWKGQINVYICANPIRLIWFPPKVQITTNLCTYGRTHPLAHVNWKWTTWGLWRYVTLKMEIRQLTKYLEGGGGGFRVCDVNFKFHSLTAPRCWCSFYYIVLPLSILNYGILTFEYG